MRTGEPSDVVVIGGGIIGLASAWRLAQRSLSVTLVDPAPGSGASHAAAGMLAPVGEVHYGEEPLLALTLAAAHRWPAFAAALTEASGIDVGYRTDGTLTVAYDDDDLAAVEELRRFQASLGLGVQRLRAAACRDREPSLSPRLRGGVLVDGDHQVDNRAVVRALLAAAERAGVVVVREPATGLSIVAGRAAGIRTPGRALPAGTVVLAAGCWSATLAGIPPDVVPPVRPVKGHILRLHGDPAAPLLAASVRGLVAGRSVYLVPRLGGELVVGASVEELGFDTTVRAGPVLALLDAATALVPGMGELELVEATAGLRPGTPDNAPIIGPSALDGLVVATGHYRNGVLLAPVTADAVAGMVADGATPPAVAAFAPGRFAPCA